MQTKVIETPAQLKEALLDFLNTSCVRKQKDVPYWSAQDGRVTVYLVESPDDTTWVFTVHRAGVLPNSTQSFHWFSHPDASPETLLAIYNSVTNGFILV